MFLVYSQDNCVACESLKKKFTSQNIPFTEVKIGRDITVEEFKFLYPNVRTVPYTVVTES